MPNDAIITFSFAGLPAGYCFTTPERFALDIASGLQGYLPGTYSTIIRSATEPVATDRDKVWVQVTVDGAPTGKVFTYAFGAWVAPNPRRDPDERVWWTGSESDAWSYDGGDGTDPSSNPPTATTGAMWMRDTDYNARFPIQAGTLPSGTALSPGDTGGEEEHVLTEAELPSHTHPITARSTNDVSNGSGTIPGRNDNLDGVVYNDTTFATYGLSIAKTGGDEAHNTLPPFKTGMWLKPTGRLYYQS